MKYLFYLFAFTLPWLFTACGDEKEIKTAPHTSSTQAQKPLSIKEYHFNFTSTDQTRSNLYIKNNHYKFSDISQSIVLVNFFATWCPPCRGMMPHLNNLQKQYAHDLSIMGLLIYDEISDEHLNICTSSHKVKYFVSSNTQANQRFANFISPKLGLPTKFDLPLMVMFVQGKYYTHYEGIAPEEMIESDIKQALNKIEGS
ncbi:MAG TPA: redoxin domain-containing protein [Campylobacterales bacterium]|nr:redoxin domain-containing protein [Campylobacterales bacterium]